MPNELGARSEQEIFYGNSFCITGGGGFIGRALAEKFIFHGAHVTSLDLTPPLDVPDSDRYTTMPVDVTDKVAVLGASKEADYLIHCAAVAGPETVINNPVETALVNSLGGIHVLEAAVGNPKIKKVVLFSTSEVYGEHAYQNKEDDNTQVGPASEPRWSYSASKLLVDHLGLAYAQKQGLPVTIVRPFNIYGPGQNKEGGAMKKFILQALKDEPITVFNDGTQVRSWCYIDDMVNAMQLILCSSRSSGEIFNIGNPSGTVTTLELAELVKHTLHSNSEIVFKDQEGVDIAVRVPDINKITTMLGFSPKVGLEEGIRKTAGYYSR